MFITENSLYTSPTEYQAIINDKDAASRIFFINVFGFLSLYSIDKTKPSLVQYLKDEKSVRPNKIGDENNDMSLAVKIAIDADVVDPVAAKELTKLLYLLKARKITDVDDNAFRNLTKRAKLGTKLYGRIRTLYKEFEDGKVSLKGLASSIVFQARLKSTFAGEFVEIAKHYRSEISSLSDDSTQDDITPTPSTNLPVYDDPDTSSSTSTPTPTIQTKDDSGITQLTQEQADEEAKSEPPGQANGLITTKIDEPRKAQLEQKKTEAQSGDTPANQNKYDITVRSNVIELFKEIAPLPTWKDVKARLKEYDIGVSKFPWKWILTSSGKNMQYVNNDEVHIAVFDNKETLEVNGIGDRIKSGIKDKKEYRDFDSKGNNAFEESYMYGFTIKASEGILTLDDISRDFIEHIQVSRVKTKSAYTSFQEVIDHPGLSEKKKDTLAQEFTKDELANDPLPLNYYSEHALSRIMIDLITSTSTPEVNKDIPNAFDFRMGDKTIESYFDSSEEFMNALSDSYKNIYQYMLDNKILENNGLGSFLFIQGGDVTSALALLKNLKDFKGFVQLKQDLIDQDSVMTLFEAFNSLTPIAVEDLYRRVFNPNNVYGSSLKKDAINEWKTFIEQHPNAYECKRVIQEKAFNSKVSTETVTLDTFTASILKSSDQLARMLSYDFNKLLALYLTSVKYQHDVSSYSTNVSEYAKEYLNDDLNQPMIDLLSSIPAKTFMFNFLFSKHDRGTAKYIPRAVLETFDVRLEELYGSTNTAQAIFDFFEEPDGEFPIPRNSSFGELLPDSFIANNKDVLNDLMILIMQRAREFGLSSVNQQAYKYVKDNNFTQEAFDTVKDYIYKSKDDADYSFSRDGDTVRILFLLNEYKNGNYTTEELTELLGEQGIAKNFADVLYTAWNDIQESGSTLLDGFEEEVKKLMASTKDPAGSLSVSFFIDYIPDEEIEAFVERNNRDGWHYRIKMLVDKVGNYDRVRNAIKRGLAESLSTKTLDKEYIQAALEDIEQIFTETLLEVDNLDEIIDSIESPTYKRRVIKTLVSTKAMENSNVRDTLYSGDIQPLTELNRDRIIQVLEYNDISFNIKNSRKRKNETYEEHIDRIASSVNVSEQLGDMKAVKIDATEDEMEAKTVEYDIYNSGRHGDTALRFLEEFTVLDSLTQPEYYEFKEQHPETVMYPVFHGTGSVAASMILRKGFTVISPDDVAAVGRMLGNGIYYSNVLDKTAQYIGDNGFGRSKGTIGYIFEMEAANGIKGTHYSAAGIDGLDDIRSPEWCVFNAGEQLSIKKAYKVQMMSRKELKRIAIKRNQLNESSFKLTAFPDWINMIKEDISNEDIQDSAVFIFKDGKLPHPKGNGSTISWKTFKSFYSEYINVHLESTRMGVSLVVDITSPEVYNLINGIHIVMNTSEWTQSIEFEQFKQMLGE